MKHCARCGLPETYETIEFDVNNICNICHQHQYKKDKVDWASRKEMFENMLEEYRGKYDYDCIVPFSDGIPLKLI